MPEADFGRKKASCYVPELNLLTEMQQRFCQEYLIDLNPRQAAIRAGYPPAKADYAARQVMKHPPASDMIAKLMAQRSARVGMTADRVLDQLGNLVFGDTRNCFDANGGVRSPVDMTRDEAMLVAGIKTRRTVALDENGQMSPEIITEVKLVDKLAATTLAMRHLGMLKDQLDINVTHTLADRLAKAYKRTADGKHGVGGPVIDGEFVENVAQSLAELEDAGRLIQNRLTHEATPAAATWADVL